MATEVMAAATTGRMSSVDYIIRRANKEEWDSIYMSCEHSTYFQSYNWAKIWEEYTKGEITPNAELIVFSEDQKVLLPKSLNTISGVSLMSPAGTFGGPLYSFDLDENQRKIIENWFAKLKKGMVFFSPYLPNIFYTNDANSNTDAIKLDQSFDLIFKNWTKGHKATINKSKKENVEISIASDKSEWREYFRIYQKSLERWGENARTSYKWELFDVLSDSTDDNIKLWVAKHSGEIIAGGIMLYSNKHVVYWHGAVDDKFFHKKPVHYMLYDAIKNAIEENYNWFDFNPSGGLDGVRKFKRGFGTTELPFFNQKFSPSLLDRLIQRLR